MSQASNWGLPESGPKTPVAYSQEGNESFDALLSMHLGTSRPAYAVQGTQWLKDTGVSPQVLEHYLFDGTNDILLGTLDVSSNTYTVELPDTVLHSDTSDTLTVGFDVNGKSWGTITTATQLTIAGGVIQDATLGGSLTLTGPNDTNDGFVEFQLTNDGTGGYTLTVAGGYTLQSGTFDPTASVTNVLKFTKGTGKSYYTIEQVA